MVDYKKPSLQLALDMINECCGSSFKLTDVNITNVKYLDEGYYNTQALLVPTDGSDYEDEVEIKYDRLNIEALFRGVDIVVPFLNQKKASDYLPYINASYDLGLVASDIDDGVIPNDALPPYRINIKMNQFNPAFYGSFEVLVSNESNSLNSIVSDGLLRGIKYPTEDKDKIQGYLYYYGYDFSKHHELLASYPTAVNLDITFKDKMNRWDNNVWVLDETPQPFNLYGSKVLYNGENFDGNPYTNKKGPDNVFVIRLDPEYCTNISGDLIIHYNDYYYGDN